MAIFPTGSPPVAAITACTVDGVQQMTVNTSELSIECQTNSSLADGTHKLYVEVDTMIEFDGIQYTPSSGNGAIGDVIYFPEDSDLKWQRSRTTNAFGDLGPGGTIDLDFIGEGKVTLRVCQFVSQQELILSS